MHTHLQSVKNAFHELDQTQQNRLLSEVYNLSQGVRELLESRLLDIVDGKALIDAMEKETLGKVFHRPVPRVPDGRKVRSIITRAKKLKANDATMMELERLAFEGFVEFLNEYGGESESFDEMACKHLEAYLRLIKKICKDEQGYAKRVDTVRRYLSEKHNMITDLLFDTFDTETNASV